MAEVVVMGGGLMGTGIAQIASQTQHKVTLVDINEGVLAKSEKRIVDSLKRVAKKMFKDDPDAGEKFVANSAGNISYATDSENSLGTADVVVEAITEVLPLKQKLFKQWDQVCPEKTEKRCERCITLLSLDLTYYRHFLGEDLENKDILGVDRNKLYH